MKYRRLSKEQFQELYFEFSQFLASHSIDAVQWKQLKRESSQKVDALLDIFSDIVWEKVLSKVVSVQYSSPQKIVLLNRENNILKAIIITTNGREVDFETQEGFQWLEKNMDSDQVVLTVGEKSSDIHSELFKWILQGGQITDGELFKRIQKLIS